MKMPNVDEECEIEGSAALPLRSAKRRNRHGSVPGLDDEELASPKELERQIVMEQWWPVLRLPVLNRENPIRPIIDEDGHLDWGAFGSVDFDKHGQKRKQRKTQKQMRMLREEFRNTVLMIGVLKARLPKAKGKVLQLALAGVIDLGQIESHDMYELARLTLRARRLQKEIQRSERRKWARAREAYKEMFDDAPGDLVGPRL